MHFHFLFCWLSFSAWFKQWHLHTDTMGYLKDLTVQFPQNVSKDHRCSRYLITCRVERTILEILESSSSVPKRCVPTQTKEWLKTSQDGDEDADSKFHQKQAENRLILHHCVRGPCHSLGTRAVSLLIIQLVLKATRFKTRTVFGVLVGFFPPFSFFLSSLHYWSILGMGTEACWQALTYPLPSDSLDLWDPKEWWFSLLFSVSWHWGRMVQKQH